MRLDGRRQDFDLDDLVVVFEEVYAQLLVCCDLQLGDGRVLTAHDLAESGDVMSENLESLFVGGDAVSASASELRRAGQ